MIDYRKPGVSLYPPANPASSPEHLAREREADEGIRLRLQGKQQIAATRAPAASADPV